MNFRRILTISERREKSRVRDARLKNRLTLNHFVVVLKNRQAAGNVFAGEVLVISITAMAAYLVPLPFMFLELIVGVIQALIFAILSLVYFTIASMEHESH